MIRRAAVGVAVIVVATLSPGALARAQETVRITEASFSPNGLGVPTNAFGNALIGSTTGPVPAPISHVDVYGPAGMTLDLRGTTTCSQQALEDIGVKACPASSHAGFGGGEGIYELGHEIVKEHYTLEFFLADNRPGHTSLLIYLEGHTPVEIQLVFDAAVITGQKPYGLGFSVSVPPIKTLPEASDASATSSFLSLGAHNLAYHETVHGRRVLKHVRGIVLPRRCPRGGWPVAAQFSFEDGSTVLAKSAVPCPR